MNLRQQIVQSNVEHTASHLGIDENEAFVRLAHSLITDQSIHAFEESDLVDGGQDKQIDVITIDDQSDEAYIFILQVKNSASFESNILIQMRNGLNWIFNKSKKDVELITNTNFKDQIKAYRSLQSSIGPSNIHVRVAYVTTAPDSVVSEECDQELKSILDEYDNDVFASFRFDYWSAQEIVDRINALEKNNKKVSADIRIRYDANVPSLIKYQTQGLTGIICSVPATEIARVVNDDPGGYVFDLNIRKYLGNKGSVNPEILKTSTHEDAAYLFWFLNNGITIVCDTVDPVTDPDDPHVKLTNMQIVNGCQTASSLADAASRGLLADEVRVLVRVYQTENSDLVDQIVLTTNNQNKISGRNLRSNDPSQSDMEEGFRLYGLNYERKPRQYDGVKSASRDTVVSNDVVATSYLAIVLKRCSDARSRKYKVWGEFYDKIFAGGGVQPYVVSCLIYYRVKASLKRYTRASEKESERYLAKNASYHIARIVSFLFRNGDSWADHEKLDGDIERILRGKVDFDELTDRGFSILVSIIDQSRDLNSVLKSSSLDSEITKALHKNNSAWQQEEDAHDFV